MGPDPPPKARAASQCCSGLPRPLTPIMAWVPSAPPAWRGKARASPADWGALSVCHWGSCCALWALREGVRRCPGVELDMLR